MTEETNKILNILKMYNIKIKTLEKKIDEIIDIVHMISDQVLNKE